MPTVKPPQNPEANPRVKAVFDDIRSVRNSDFINNVWRYLAFDPNLLEETWREVKSVMATPSELDPSHFSRCNTCNESLTERTRTLSKILL